MRDTSLKTLFQGERFITLIARKSCVATALLCALGATACNLKTLTPLDRYLPAPPANENTIDVTFCTDPAYQQKFAVKTLLILDHSGSNKTNYQMNPNGSGDPYIVNNTLNISGTFATDPYGLLRYGSELTTGTLLNFLSTAPANDPLDPSRYFAVVNFSDAATTYPANMSGFTSDIGDFYTHIKADAQGSATATGTPYPQDSGSTSYLAALTAANNIINADINQAKNCFTNHTTSESPSTTCPHPGVQVASSYVIVFMSDGSPITEIDNVGTDPSGNIVVTGTINVVRESTNDILGAVQTLTGLTANSKYVSGLNLFSIYYYNPTNALDGAGQTLLAQMAKVGNGISYLAQSGSKIDYNRFVPPSKTIKYSLSDIFVTNNNVAWDSQGQVALDTDGDGLPDSVELAWGSNPNKADTDGNGVSDLVEYNLRHGAAITTAVNYSACNAISSTTSAGNTIYTSSDPNGLNDCEKALLSDVGGINNPDSNGDIVPDWLEFKNGVPFQLNASLASSGVLSAGYTYYDRIKYTLPTNVPLTQLISINPAKYDLQVLSDNASQTCYKLDVTELPMIGTGNNIRVDVVEKSALLQDQYLYRTAHKPFPATGYTLHFSDWNDATEISAGTWTKWP